MESQSQKWVQNPFLRLQLPSAVGMVTLTTYRTHDCDVAIAVGTDPYSHKVNVGSFSRNIEISDAQFSDASQPLSVNTP